MIMDLQGWGRIHNHFSPGSTVSHLHTLSVRKFIKENNSLHCFSVFSKQIFRKSPAWRFCLGELNIPYCSV